MLIATDLFCSNYRQLKVGLRVRFFPKAEGERRGKRETERDRDSGVTGRINISSLVKERLIFNKSLVKLVLFFIYRVGVLLFLHGICEVLAEQSEQFSLLSSNVRINTRLRLSY